MNALDYYETDRALSEYLLFHYGSAPQVLPWSFGPAGALDYPVRCVSECLEFARLPGNARGLDLGCAVGRSTFELARHCSRVIGIDYSHRFIEVARRLQIDGAFPFALVEEGQLRTPATAVVPADIDRSRVTFEQGDAQALQKDLGQFDVVLLANLLDRLREPHRCLVTLPDLVAGGGQLIITTPCTWLEEYTAQANWLGGFLRDGKPVTTLATLRHTLEPHFSLSQTRDLPFLIREHSRKFQWSVALATVWIRHSQTRA
ncbi:MAG: putative 4-mercaptohistidine N1-methyltransferase [Verrucomicrobia bacterium]|nr:putative 4-mercaptohistidine N1-methyltransferase [Verrucomicrobiota bacterium]